ncbi:Mce protein [Mycobacterium sp. MMS18-G62]
MAHKTTINGAEIGETTSEDRIAAEGHEMADANASEDSDETGNTSAEIAVDNAEADRDADVTDDPEAGEPAAPKPRMSHVRMAALAGMVVVLALGGLTGWLGYRTYESREAQNLHNLFLEVGRQGALNLTTIDWEHAEADVQRVVDSSTRTFRDDFQKRATPFIEVVKQAKSKSTGHITEAGVGSASDHEAQVVVAVSVNTSNAGAPEQQPRSWRMRISVQKTGDDEAKVSNVEFVP